MTNILEDDAVSEVISIILLVALTIIIAAVIAAFVFGLGSNMQKTKVVATSAYQVGDDILINYLGGTNDPELSHLVINAPDGKTYITVSKTGQLALSGTPVRPDIGSVIILYNNATPGRDRVIVVGHFNDDAIQVLLDRTI